MSEGTHSKDKRARREEVNEQIESDAVQINADGETTTVSLFYHEPSATEKVVTTPLGPAVALVEPNSEELMTEVLERVSAVTQPDRMDVADENGYYVVTLTYEDDNSF